MLEKASVQLVDSQQDEHVEVQEDGILGEIQLVVVHAVQACEAPLCMQAEQMLEKASVQLVDSQQDEHVEVQEDGIHGEIQPVVVHAVQAF